jgi:hypothetical protein
MSPRADVRHIVDTNMTLKPENSNGQNDLVRTVASALTVELRDAALEELRQCNPLGADYLVNKVGLQRICRCYFWGKKIRLYGQTSGVTSVDSECVRLLKKSTFARANLWQLVLRCMSIGTT